MRKGTSVLIVAVLVVAGLGLVGVLVLGVGAAGSCVLDEGGYWELRENWSQSQCAQACANDPSLVNCEWMAYQSGDYDVGSCVETWSNQPTTYRDGWSRAECRWHCDNVNVGVHLSCFFEP